MKNNPKSSISMKIPQPNNDNNEIKFKKSFVVNHNQKIDENSQKAQQNV